MFVRARLCYVRSDLIQLQSDRCARWHVARARATDRRHRRAVSECGRKGIALRPAGYSSAQPLDTLCVDESSDGHWIQSGRSVGRRRRSRLWRNWIINPVGCVASERARERAIPVRVRLIRCMTESSYALPVRMVSLVSVRLRTIGRIGTCEKVYDFEVVRRNSHAPTRSGVHPLEPASRARGVWRELRAR